MSAVLSNLIPVLVVVVLVWALVRARRAPLWAEAYRRLGRNHIAMAALAVICLYGLVAFLDSLSWKDSRNDDPKSVIDRVFARPKERTYSAPCATMTTGEPHPRPLKGWHLLGTDGVGDDVLYRTLKGCRTAVIIGGFTSLIVTPLALFFGMLAGYFGKRVDDAVQYTYTVLVSIPDILLLIALLLVLGRGLPQLCIALGITSWVGLCRLVRGETLKHRDREYVRAARALGVSHGRILLRHILPNLLPVVIISVTLGFSGLVLSESILSYLGIGVGPEVGSWGNMIDAARMELAREPIIWWNLTAASVALFILVLAFNIFGDALRDAIDPRLRSS
ncbi:MAG TPA: ABC transporter permease [Chthonomonadaceae bacterium]|nr:ABC transporter permease [Chthonomonadaceae bacterium]